MYSSCSSCCFFCFFLPQLLLVLLLCGLLCRTLATRVSSVVVCVATSCCCPCSGALNYTFMDSTLVRSSLCPSLFSPHYALFAAAIVLAVCLSLPSLSYELMQFLESFLRFRSLFFLFIRVNFVFANATERERERERCIAFLATGFT